MALCEPLCFIESQRDIPALESAVRWHLGVRSYRSSSGNAAGTLTFQEQEKLGYMVDLLARCSAQAQARSLLQASSNAGAACLT